MAIILGTRLAAKLASATAPMVLQDHNAAVPVTVADVVEVLAAGAANADVCGLDIIVPVDAAVDSIVFACDAMGASATADINFYRKTTEPSGPSLVIIGSVGAVMAALDVSGAVTPADKRFTVLDIDTVNQPIWQLAGLTARPDYAEIIIGVSFPVKAVSNGGVMLKVSHRPL
jgi:hypothetical protein